MVKGLKIADSNKIFFVLSVTQLFSHPIIPAIARIFLLSLITKLESSKLFLLPSSVFTVSFFFANLTLIVLSDILS